MKKLSNTFHQGAPTKIIFGWFLQHLNLKKWANFSSSPSFETDDKKQFHFLNIVLNNNKFWLFNQKTEKSPLTDFYHKIWHNSQIW